MKDIDFDELDKAVSSVLSKGATTTLNKETKTETASGNSMGNIPDSAESIPVQVTSSPKKDTNIAAAPAIEQPAASTEQAPVESVKVEPALEKPASTESKTDSGAAPTIRRAGRFMDVVHPSSDMAGPKAAVAPTNRVSMSGKTLQPIAAGNAFTTEAEVTPEKVIEKPTATTPATKPDAIASEDPAWPDPINTPSVDTNKVTSPKTEDATVPVNITAASPEIAASPFIDDPQVEKRPLGAFSETAQTQSTLPREAAADATHEEPLVAEAGSEVLPPELDVDVISVESDIDTVENEPSQVNHSVHATTAQAGTLSIPKQYQEAERPEDTSAHSLFDTKDYHPPLNVHTDNSHRFLWVWVVIAALLLLGTAGLFAYWYTEGIAIP